MSFTVHKTIYYIIAALSFQKITFHSSYSSEKFKYNQLTFHSFYIQLQQLLKYHHAYASIY